MKRFATSMLTLVCLAVGAARWLDLVNCTDLATGFSTYGPYWVRYAVLAGVLALAALAALMAPRCPEALGGHSAVQGVLLLVCGLGFAVLGGVQLGGWSGISVWDRVLAVLYLLTAVWMLLLGRSRFTPEFEAPTGSALFGVVGTLAFYLLTIQRFCIVPTGIVRVGEIFDALAALAALLLCTGQLKVAYVPGGKSGGWMFFTGIAAFLLCTCLALPGVVCEYLVGLASLAQLLQGVCFGLVGLSGLFYAFTAVGPAAQQQEAGAQ